MRRPWKKGSIRVQWLVSYLALLLLPFLFGIIIYLFSMNVIQEKAGEVWSQSMERTEAVLEGTLDTISKMGNSLLNSSGTRALYYGNLRESYDLNQRVSLSQLKDAISNAQVANDMIDELYVYFPQTGHILNDNSVFFAEDEGMFHYWFRNSKKELFAEIGDSLYQTVHIVKRGESRRLVFTTCTAPTASLEEQEAVILVYLHAAKLRGLLETEGLQTILWQESQYLSYGEMLEDLRAERQIMTEKEKEDREQTLSDLEGKEKNGSSMKKGDHYILRHPMQRYQMSILQIIPTNQYLSDLHRVLWMLAGYVLVCMVLGIVLVIYFLNRNYAPVKELLSLTRKMNRKGEGEAEFVQIRKLVETLLERYFEGQQVSQEQASIQRSICFYRLLNGKNRYSSISEEDWRTIQENVPGDQYLLYSINLEQVKGEWGDKGGEMIPEEIRKLLYFVVGNVAEELLSGSGRWNFYGAAVLDSYVFLLNGGGQACYDELWQISGQIDRFLKQHYEVEMSFSVSDVHLGREGIQECWHEIELLNQYREKAGEDDTILLYTNWEREQKRQLEEQKWLEEQEHLKEQSRPEEQERLKEQSRLEEQEQLEEQESLEQERGAKAGKDKERQPEPGGSRGRNQKKDREAECLGEYVGNSVSNERRKSGKSVKKGNHVSVAVSQTGEEKNLADQVAEYIEEHYTDKLLSGGMLADQFGLSQSNLTQKFKRKKDIGVMEYIDYVRLENAKRLLAEGYTVKETADKVGYYNTRPLIRIFRDIEGVTPAEYRAMFQEKRGS